MSRFLNIFKATVLIGLFLNSMAVAKESTIPNNIKDKSSYTFFNPTPISQMRPLSADRPDGTESPYTVDAGHFQLEISLFDFAHNNDANGRTNTYTAFDSNFKIGLTNQTDLQIIMPLIAYQESTPKGGSASRITGTGDVTVRLKVNLWGNDGGKTAFGIMPFIKIPTSTQLSNDHVEGGLIFSYAWEAGETWDLGFMLELDAIYDDVADNYDTQWVHTIVLGTDLVGDLGAYFEYIGTAANTNPYQAVFSTGLTYDLTDNLILDIGIMLGLNEAAEDMRVFTGFTWRY